MRKNYLLLVAMMISSGLVAQTLTNTPPAAPIPASPSPQPTNEAAAATNAVAASTNAAGTTKTNAPKAKATKKKSEKKSAPKKREAAAAEWAGKPLVAGPAVVVASNVNVRGQAKLNSEVIAKVQKGQTVNVLEEITLKKSATNEPSAWAKIILPADVHVWVHASFISSTTKTVIPKKLKLRGGPGEEYSMVGIIKQGDEVKEVGTKGDWMEIQAPAEASGFVAARYLKQEAPTAPVEAPPTVAVEEKPAVVPAPPEPAPVAPTNETAAATPPAPTEEKPAVEEPPPRRIVDREGIVRGTFSIQAPTKFELVSPDTGKVINYLYSAAAGLDLRQYKGMRIMVTGEESLDERWVNTPVITIQRIQVLE